MVQSRCKCSLVSLCSSSSISPAQQILFVAEFGWLRTVKRWEWGFHDSFTQLPSFNYLHLLDRKTITKVTRLVFFHSSCRNHCYVLSFSLLWKNVLLLPYLFTYCSLACSCLSSILTDLSLSFHVFLNVDWKPQSGKYSYFFRRYSLLWSSLKSDLNQIFWLEWP